jgi:hypothetical protein
VKIVDPSGFEVTQDKYDHMYGRFIATSDHIGALQTRVRALEAALRDAIYEVSHDTTRAWDGKYRPHIYATKVDEWRKALAEQGKPT